MERGSKRKAAAALAASSPSNNDRASKRQKTPVPDAQDDHKQDHVTEIGLKWIAFARRAKDASGNPTTTEFLTLPSKREYPEYYDTIRLPLAIDTIEQKILDKQYPSISAIESDIRRLIQNAKDYNESGSDIFLNAERLRKLTHNFMKTNNPDHKRPDYVPKPTPVPEQITVAPTGGMKIRLKTGKDSTPAPASTKDASRDRRSRGTSTPAAPVPHKSASVGIRPTTENPSPDQASCETSFKGKTFQEAQEQILHEMSKHREEGDEVNIFEPFVQMPSRKLTEYYSIIKDPTSINKVLQKVKGFQVRGKYSGVSDFRTWDAFANETARIWTNARIFNEDGSAIFTLSEELEQYFNSRLAEAKKHVQEPPQPTLKLNMPKNATNSLKLRLGPNKDSSTPFRAQTPSAGVTGVSVDASALERQKQAVLAATGGQTSTSASRPTTQDGVPPTLENGIKTEAPSGPSPLQSDTQARPGSQQSASGARLSNGTHPSHPGQSHGYVPPAPSGFDNKFRKEGTDASDALMTSLHLTAAPYSGPKHPFVLSIPASDELTQQFITLNLTYAQLPTSGLLCAPHISPDIAFNKTRPHRVFVTLSNTNIPNGQRLAPIPSFRNTQLGLQATAGDGMQRYELKFAAGLNRVEVEVVAVAEGALGAGTLARNGGLEMEKMTVFVNLMRT